MEQIVEIGLNTEKNSLSVKWSDDHVSRWHVKWIRHNCQCNRCVRKVIAEYPVNKSSLDPSIKFENAELKGREIQCAIDKDIMENHIIKLPLDFLLKYCNCNDCLMREVSSRDVENIDPKNVQIPRIEYAETTDDAGFFKCLQHIVTFGFCVVKNFPVDSIENVRKFASSFGPIRVTNYGELWEVKNKQKPINFAYTTAKLPFHQDQPNYEVAPGVQFLLAARFDDTVTGGESLFVDLLRLAEIFRIKEPEHFRTLCRIPCCWETKDFSRADPVWLEHSKTHIEVDYFGKVVAVNWHPALEATLRVREEDYAAYYAACDAFFDLINNDDNQFKFRLNPGEMVIFNNRRMAHSRTFFNAPVADSRTLWGTYIELDDLRSKYMTLAHKLGIEAIPSKLGNRSSF